MRDIWEYFEGESKQAVLGRFVDRVREELRENVSTDEDLTALSKASGLPVDFFHNLRASPKPHELLSAEVIEDLAAVLTIDMRECFRPRELNEKELEEVIGVVVGDDFMPMAPAGGTSEGQWEAKDVVSLFLVVSALRELDSGAA